MRKLIVPLVVAAFASSGPAFAAKPNRTPAYRPPATQQPIAQTQPVAPVSTVTASRRTPPATQNSRRRGSPVATPASQPSIVVPDCNASLGIFGTTASSCAGFFTGNVLSGSPADTITQENALAQLGFDFSGDLTDYVKIDTSDATFLDFGQQLYGNTIIGIHFGNGSGIDNATGFFEFDFGSAVNGISLNVPGSSGVVLYQTGAPPPGGIPEPSTWAMMLLGFGAVGFSLRRTRNRRLIPQLA